MTLDAPGPGLRVRQYASEYKGTQVHHALYLPTNWKPGRKYPVLVEYTGNEFPKAGSTGRVEDANLGFGLSGGKDFIWVSMPYVSEDGQSNALRWWGDRAATVDYCKRNLPRICEAFGGDSERLILCGFSRGSLALSYIGLADDEIARMWKAFVGHDHFDGERPWPYPESDRNSALKRLDRLQGRPVLYSGTPTLIRKTFLREYQELADFTLIEVPVDQIFDIPEGGVIHPHTDRWMFKPSPQRDTVRAWLYAQAGLPAP